MIADSLGGVSNAYNITPQNSTMNRHGDQAYMEKNIRAAGGCKDFVAIITYPDTKTQIPSHYSYTYTLKGNVINDEFDNINPDDTYGKKKTPAVTPAKPTEKPKKTPVVVPVKPAAKPTKPANSGGGSNYVLNTNSKKYHLPTCGSAKRMKGSNKKEVKDTKANLEKQGYQNCKRCLK